MEKFRNFHCPLYVCLIDLRKEYNSINCEALWSILQYICHFPAKLLFVIWAVYDGSRAAVTANGRVSESFEVTCGVCQGCVLAPAVFNLYFDAVIHMALDNHREHNKGIVVVHLHNAMLVGNCRKLQLQTVVTDLEYANDIVWLADSWYDLQVILTSLSTYCLAFGFSISCEKTKSMAVLPSSACEPTSIHRFPKQPSVEPINNFQYLGSVIQDDYGSDVEVNSRLCKAS